MAIFWHSQTDFGHLFGNPRWSDASDKIVSNCDGFTDAGYIFFGFAVSSIWIIFLSSMLVIVVPGGQNPYYFTGNPIFPMLPWLSSPDFVSVERLYLSEVLMQSYNRGREL